MQVHRLLIVSFGHKAPCEDGSIRAFTVSVHQIIRLPDGTFELCLNPDVIVQRIAFEVFRVRVARSE